MMYVVEWGGTGFVALAGALLLCGCNHTGRRDPAAGELEDIPSLTVELAQFDDGGFGEFLEDNAGDPVDLDVTIPKKEFQGGQEKDFAFFTIYDECPEDLDEGEKPNSTKCGGTEYLLPKKALHLEGGVYKINGIFRPAEKAGPNQGLFSVKLDPVHH